MRTSYDLLVVGGGVMGLWIARCAVRSGLSVAVVDCGRCGAGASGGLLGALMPHMPTRWSPKKQFQFEALAELEQEIETLGLDTGLSTGYERSGRIIPIRHEEFKTEAAGRVAASHDSWNQSGGTFIHEIHEPRSGSPAPFSHWLAPEAAPFGVLHDNLSARIDPRGYISALVASLQSSTLQADIFNGWCFESYDAARGQARATDGTELCAAHVVLAAGAATYQLLAPMVGHCLGGGIKGQAALFACKAPSGMPVIYDNGVYIVPHTGGRVAVGSTTEKTWLSPDTTDEKAEAFIQRAREICPPLRDADVVERWADIRPKSAARDPMAGRLPDCNKMSVATGGFKITLGIAHRLACWLVDDIAQAPPTIELPPSFHIEAHLASASGVDRSASRPL
ncbi:MAG TPA: FAD-dependent oxidoreductase [Hyphomicrobiaceae bacterium]|nr:FAD-dependent oxidoreductase [Hyphomicrobiaceae bacterium]